MKNTKNNNLQHQIELVRAALQDLESLIQERKFIDDKTNKEEALDEMESAFITLDDLSDIIERDEELALMKESIE
jgi:AMMECR1 domain-containing protein